MICARIARRAALVVVSLLAAACGAREASTIHPNFRSDEHARRYLDAYDAVLEAWPVSFEARDIDTAWGRTHVKVSGPEQALPLVLLPAMNASSTMWHANIEALSEANRVYAIDTIGAAGKSVAVRPLETREDFELWLHEVLEQLGLERASFMGSSHGGWLALTFAMAEPERVDRLALLGPAGSFTPMKRSVFSRVTLAYSVRTRPVLEGFFRWAGNGVLRTDGVYALTLEQAIVAMQGFRAEVKFLPTVYTDEELRALAPPVLLLLGENDVLYAAEPALARAGALIPDLDAEIVTGAGHGVQSHGANGVNDRVLAFLAQSGAPS